MLPQKETLLRPKVLVRAGGNLASVLIHRSLTICFLLKYTHIYDGLGGELAAYDNTSNVSIPAALGQLQVPFLRQINTQID